MASRQYWTATRNRGICHNLGYPTLHSETREAMEDFRGMDGAGYENLDIVHVTVLTSWEVAEMRRQIKEAVAGLELIAEAETTLGQDPDVLLDVKRMAARTLGFMETRKEVLPESWKKKR